MVKVATVIGLLIPECSTTFTPLPKLMLKLLKKLKLIVPIAVVQTQLRRGLWTGVRGQLLGGTERGVLL
jgi:hypothetical protein